MIKKNKNRKAEKILFAIITAAVLLFAAPRKAEASDVSYSTNVTVETNAYTYRCAQGQKFNVEIIVRTEEPYEEKSHKYIGYLAFLDGGWQQIKSWFIDGGVVKYTFTLDSSDYAEYYDVDSLLFTASVFPADNFTEGASLYDRFFRVSFLKPSFQLSYHANGGTLDAAPGSIIYNFPYGELPVPVRTGYSFAGWYTSISGGERIDSDTIVSVTSDQKIYAHWEPNIYRVNLNANGGSCTHPSISGTYGEKYTGLSQVAVTPPEGKSFAGWYTAASGGTKITASSAMVTLKEHTLYAHWDVLRSYEISYDANGGIGEPDSQIKYHGIKLDLSSEKPVREGYTFQGWSTIKNAANARYYAGASYTKNEAAVLYAVWKANTYTVNYNGNGGTEAPNQQTKHYGTSLTLSSMEPYRTGYRFLGWSTDRTSEHAAYHAGGEYTENHNVTLYAVWEKEPAEIKNPAEVKNPAGNTADTTTTENTKKQQRIITSANSYIKEYGSKAFLIKAKTDGGGKLTYTSSDKKVAIVSAAGKVSVKGYGTARITIKAAAAGDYQSAVKTVTVRVVPKKIALKSVKSPLKGKVQVSWKKNKDAAGYQICVSQRKDFKKNTIQKAYKKDKLSQKISGLKSKKTYYVRIRAYKKVKGVTYYGTWSKVVKVRVK